MMTSTIQEYSINMECWLSITDKRNSTECATVTIGTVNITCNRNDVNYGLTARKLRP